MICSHIGFRRFKALEENRTGERSEFDAQGRFTDSLLQYAFVHDLTLEELCGMIGMSVTDFHLIQSKKRDLYMLEVERTARILGIPPADLFRGFHSVNF